MNIFSSRWNIELLQPSPEFWDSDLSNRKARKA
jgi:hypothetical protein